MITQLISAIFPIVLSIDLLYVMIKMIRKLRDDALDYPYSRKEPVKDFDYYYEVKMAYNHSLSRIERLSDWLYSYPHQWGSTVARVFNEIDLERKFMRFAEDELGGIKP